MNKHCIFFVLALLFVSSFIHAQDSLQNTFSLSVNASAYRYHEVTPFDSTRFEHIQFNGNYPVPPGEKYTVMEFKGTFIGLDMNYRHLIKQKILISPTVHYRLGFTTYSSINYYGAILFNIHDVRDNMFELDIETGYVLSFNKCYIIPKAGVGFRFLYNNLERGWRYIGYEVRTGFLYNRISRYLFIPLGAEFEYLLGDKNSVSVMMRYNYFIEGLQTSFLSHRSDEFYDAQNKQKTGFGLNASVSYTQKLDSRKSIFIKPFFELWRIDKSENFDFVIDPAIEAKANEPENQTINAGVGIGMSF